MTWHFGTKLDPFPWPFFMVKITTLKACKIMNFKPSLFKLWNRAFLMVLFENKQKQFSVHRHFNESCSKAIPKGFNLHQLNTVKGCGIDSTLPWSLMPKKKSKEPDFNFWSYVDAYGTECIFLTSIRTIRNVRHQERMHPLLTPFATRYSLLGFSRHARS